MTNERIAALSKMLKRITLVACISIPSINIFFWTHFQSIQLRAMYLRDIQLRKMTFVENTPYLGFMADCIPTVVLLMILFTIFRICEDCERGNYYSTKNIKRCFRLTKLFFFWVLAKILRHSLLSMILTINNPPGHRILSLSINSDHMILLACACGFIMIGLMIQEAQKLKRFNQMVV